MSDVVIEIFKNAVTIIIAALSWVVAHKFTSKRDIANKRRDTRIRFLLDSYVKLSNSVHRIGKKKDFENAIADIQFLGNEKQIILAKRVVEELGNNGNSNIDELICELRNDLRKELDIEETKQPFNWLRFD